MQVEHRIRPRTKGHKMLTIAKTKAVNGDITRLVFDRDGGPGCFPMRPFGIRLPSGLIHWFESEGDARDSQYWPFVVVVDSA